MLLLLPILASAQTLKGVVVDASKQSPLAGATILTPDGKGVATNKMENLKSLVHQQSRFLILDTTQ
jgi:hypothetical protein